MQYGENARPQLHFLSGARIVDSKFNQYDLSTVVRRLARGEREILTIDDGE
jgi:hypothetical protein